MARNFAINFFLRMFSNSKRTIARDVRGFKALQEGIDDVNKSANDFELTVSKLTVGLGIAGLAGATAASIARAATFDAKIARVAITLQGTASDLEILRRGLLRVSSQTGRSTEDLAAIAEMAGQAGFASKLGAKGMVEFADILARFTVVAKIGAPEAGRIFTRLADQLKIFKEGDAKGNIRQLNKLASTIALVGKNSVSGSAEVARFMESLLPLRQITNLTIPEMMALAGAARSFGRITPQILGSQPQRIFQRIFETGRAEEFAKVIGVDSVQALNDLVNTDPFEFLMKLFGALETVKASTQDYQLITKALGLTNLRLVPILAGASSQVDKIRFLLKKAKKEMAGTGEVLRGDFGTAMNTFNEQLGIAVTNLDNLGKAAGKPFLTPLTAGLYGANAAMRGLVAFGNTWIGQLLTMTLMISPFISLIRIMRSVMTGTVLAGGVREGLAASFAKFGTSQRVRDARGRMTKEMSHGLGARIKIGLEKAFVGVFGVEVAAKYVKRMSDFSKKMGIGEFFGAAKKKVPGLFGEAASKAGGLFGRMKTAMFGFVGGIKTAIPFLQQSLWIAGEIVVIAAVLGKIIQYTLGPGLEWLWRGTKLIFRTVKEAISVGSISVRDFKELQKMGLEDLFIGLTVAGRGALDFVNAFMGTFDGFGETLAVFGKPFKFIVDLFFTFLNTLGVLPAGIGELTFGIKAFAKILGWIIRLPFEALALAVDFFMKPLIDGFKMLKKLGVFRFIGDILSLLARVAINTFVPGALGYTGIGRSNVTIPAGGSPAQVAASPGSLGAATGDIIAASEARRARGYVPAPGEIAGEAVQVSYINVLLDNTGVGKAIQRQKNLTARRRGAPAF